ncbi:hypothetical protein KUTeg_015418 [Tegillarca granosa]|uniref:EGF-like domain-containing protein n=1 Tax=Tegillarca granosa TaxID=220873 RepID=A0ABQ9EQN4_TEGGR|nr:hypothetical protein KUTeg_015418 [Tegillarca granosa]
MYCKVYMKATHLLVIKSNYPADDDECTNRICQHKCNNTKGGFVCSCHAGFMLDTDGFSCRVILSSIETTKSPENIRIYSSKKQALECEIRKWGINCANYCNCVNGECDPVFGCQCDAGFSGSKCNQDVNECKITGICNDPYKTCFNTYGSYDCRCKDGYYEENKICKKPSKYIHLPFSWIIFLTPSSIKRLAKELFLRYHYIIEDINECNDITLNQCDEKTTTCVDTIGNFTCVCNPGYFHDGLYKCKVSANFRLLTNIVVKIPNIDECSIGHPCEQICINNEGSYQCQCQNGFSIMDDRSHCKKIKGLITKRVSDYEHCPSFNCSYSCTLNNGISTCSCPSWSELDSDRKTCKGKLMEKSVYLRVRKFKFFYEVENAEFISISDALWIEVSILTCHTVMPTVYTLFIYYNNARKSFIVIGYDNARNFPANVLMTRIVFM